jgi:hypothetical protein
MVFAAPSRSIINAKTSEPRFAVVAFLFCGQITIPLWIPHREHRSIVFPHFHKQIISALVEGNSVRATCRMTGHSKGAVLKLLAQVGQACLDFQDTKVRNVKSCRIQCDEIWAFCYAKEKTSRRISMAFSTIATCGHGRQLMRIPSWQYPGMWVSAILKPRRPSSTILLKGYPIASS